MNNTLFVGIDISKRSNVATFMNCEGKVVGRLTFSNNGSGADRLVAKILSYYEKEDFEAIRIGMENTSVYSKNLVWFLYEHEALNEHKLSIIPLNAIMVANYKKSFLDMDKDDITDSFAIADFIRIRPGLLPFKLDDRQEALKIMTRSRYNYVQALSRMKSQFLTRLFLSFSEMEAGKPFYSIFSKTSLSLLEEEFTLDELAEKPISELVEFLQEKGGGKFQNPEEIAKVLKKAASSSYRVPAMVRESLNRTMASDMEIMRILENEIHNCDKNIEKLMKSVPAILVSIPGIGPVLAAGIMSEIGDISRFQKQESLGKMAGFKWKRNQSGKKEAEDKAAVLSGNKKLRYYLVEAANRVRIHDPVFEAYYRKKYAESKTHAHKRALILTARKLVRVIFYLLKENKLYKPDVGIS